MKIQKLILNPPFEQEFTVGLAQIRSPFFDDVDKIRQESGHTLGLSEKTASNYKDRIIQLHNMLDEVSRNFREINILVIPEYAFLKSDRGILIEGKNTFEICEEFVSQSKIILIGNYYDESRRASVSFLIIPQEYVKEPFQTVNEYNVYTFFAEKYTRTSYDADFLAPIDLENDESQIIQAWWKPKNSNTDGYFEILTCKDYLFFTSIEPLRTIPDVIRIDFPGVLIAPLCSPDIITFESRALVLLRDIDNKTGSKSLVSCFCNATTQHKQIANFTNPICGHSQVISPVDTHRQVNPYLKTGLEGLIVATINPFKSLERPTPTTEREANAVLISSKAYEFVKLNNDTIFHIVEHGRSSRPHTGYIINPTVLQKIGFRRVYGLLRLNDYQKFKQMTKIRFCKYPELAIAFHGIYGIYDLLSLSWEEFFDQTSAREILKLRLWPFLKEASDLDENHFACCYIERFIKFHGQIIDEDVNIASLRIDGDDTFRQKFRDFMLGTKPDDELLQELIGSNILFPTSFDTSDISDQERRSGKIEFLIFVGINETDASGTKRKAKKEFDHALLETLKSDHRVRTIEEVSADRSGYVEVDYILHFVGDIADLNGLIIEQLQNHQNVPSEEIMFRCKTMVIIPAEQISASRHPALLEETKIKSIESNILSIINEWKRLEQDEDKLINDIVPNCIHFIKETVLRQMLQSYFLADTVTRTYLSKDSHWMPAFFKMLYAISAGIGGYKVEYNISPSFSMLLCTPFVLSLSKEVECAIVIALKKICDNVDISVKELETDLNDLISFFKAEGRLSIDRMEIGTVGLVLEKLNSLSKEKYIEQVKKWLIDTKRNTENDICARMEIYNKITKYLELIDLIKTAKDLQKFSKIRNAFSHAREPEDVKPDEIMEGVFSGLRILDQVDQMLSYSGKKEIQSEKKKIVSII